MRNSIKYIGILVFLTGLLVSSCGVNSNIMFKTPKGMVFKYDSIPMHPQEEYKISVDDKLTFYLYPNNGEKLIEVMSGTYVSSNEINIQGGGNKNFFIFEYLVKSDGEVELPIVGNVKATGLTIPQFQDSLKRVYSNQYNTPFVKVEISNQRCIVFTGNGNIGEIIPIQNNNTTLMEVLALAGGIDDRGQTKLVKLMRKVNGKREIYLIDLSTIEGLKYVDMVVQGNDYIYVEPKPQLAKGILAEIAPVMTLISTTILAVSLFKLN